jgi:hypothetical protein
MEEQQWRERESELWSMCSRNKSTEEEDDRRGPSLEVLIPHRAQRSFLGGTAALAKIERNRRFLACYFGWV